jgi:cytochrome c-type biogenesis protein CcsB
VQIAEYIPNGIASAKLREGSPDDPPGIVFSVTSGPQRVERWLIAGDSRFSQKNLGPVDIELRLGGPDAAAEDRPHAGADAHANVFISAGNGAEPVKIHLPDQLGEDVPLDSGRIVRVHEFFQRARVVNGKLSENEAGDLNPAAIVEIRAQGRSEIHTLFGRYPDFNGVSGRDPNQPLAAMVRMDTVSHAAKPQLAILLGPDAQLQLQINRGSGPAPAVPVAIGRSVSLTALSLELRIERLLPNARPEFGVQTAPAGSDEGRAYLRLEAGENGAAQSVWVERDGRWGEWKLAGGTLAAFYGAQSRALPFAIALEEFELIHYPGSSRPAEYRSRVQVRPEAANLPLRNEIISMNRPLDVAGFRLFQSSYKLGEAGRPDATVLSVSYDPGVPIVYASFGMLILGIAWGLRGVRPTPQRADGPLERRSAAGAGATGRAAAMHTLALLLAVVAGLAATADAWAQPASAGEALPVEATRGWAILADGRTKPLLTYANEITLAITGRESLDGLTSLEILWGYALNTHEFKQRPYVRVDSLELKKKLGLDAKEKRFAFDALLNHPSFQELVEHAIQHQQQGGELPRLEKDVLATYSKLERIAGLAAGNALTIVPANDPNASWLTPAQLRNDADPARLAVHQGFGRLAATYAAGDAAGFDREARSLTVALRSAAPAAYPPESDLAREIFYEDFNAFGKAWLLYLLGFLAILLVGFSERPWGYVAGVALVAAGFVCHSVGLGVRWIIADRAPVSDMYESLVFMGWGAIALGLIAESVNRKRFLALSAGLMGFVCLAFAENLPINSGINPLVPVLAHTYWLSVHVMTVMLSYSAFALAMVLGHVMLFVEVFQKGRIPLLRTLAQLLYKTLQVGVLFLAAGIIFGAVWANESWGRYWGWDPKETWSLITFFVYLAIIHARFAGWLRFFGLAATAILGFLAVVMTYYGVNFILSAGMHAYGFSEGGQFWVALYAVLEIAIVVGARLRLGATKKLSPPPVARPDTAGA